MLLTRLCPSDIVHTPRIIKPAEILALLTVKLEDMPDISTNTIKTTRASIKYFQESIQNQAMAIATCDHSLGLLGMVLQA